MFSLTCSLQHKTIAALFRYLFRIVVLFEHSRNGNNAKLISINIKTGYRGTTSIIHILWLLKLKLRRVPLRA